MTPQEHYAEGEDLLEQADSAKGHEYNYLRSEARTALAARATAHFAAAVAALALAEAPSTSTTHSGVGF